MVKVFKNLPQKLIILSYAALFFGLTSAYLKFLAPFHGFLIFLIGIVLAVVSAILFIVYGIWKKDFSLLKQTVYTVPILSLLGFYVYSRSGQPILNDVATNLESPAKFIDAKNELIDLNSPFTEDQMKTLRKIYPDLTESKYNFPCFRIYEESLKIIGDTPSASLKNTGQEPYRIQYTQSSSVFRFLDDVAIQLSDGPEKTCILSMRSRSRDGKADFGVNFKRIQTFNRHLQDRLQQ